MIKDRPNLGLCVMVYGAVQYGTTSKVQKSDSGRDIENSAESYLFFG